MSSLFFSEYIKNFREVGAVAPSSRFLASKMLQSIDFDQAKVIVEYGPGTGVFTAQIMQRMKPRTKLIIIESNHIFYTMLRSEYVGVKNIEIINESAEHIESLLKIRGIANPDYIVSGLPFAALPQVVSHAILEATSRLLGDKGTFVTFQYTLFKQKLIASYFPNITVTRELRNIPPAYVLSCKKVSSSSQIPS